MRLALLVSSLVVLAVGSTHATEASSLSHSSKTHPCSYKYPTRGGNGNFNIFNSKNTSNRGWFSGKNNMFGHSRNGGIFGRGGNGFGRNSKIFGGKGSNLFSGRTFKGKRVH